MKLIKILDEHKTRYPLMTIQDYQKLIYQLTFGPDHAIKNEQETLLMLQQEINQTRQHREHRFENIGDQYVRYILHKDDELPINILHKMFLYSAKISSPPTEEVYQTNMKILQSFVNSDILDSKIITSPFSHSMIYKQQYHPHYRVLDIRFKTFFPLIMKLVTLCKDNHIILTIDGMCGSGKTTLANMLSFIFDASIVHMDDFFLRPTQKTQTRLEEIGGYFDYERFDKEVIKELVPCHDFDYLPFDCCTQAFKKSIHIKRGRLIIIEGVYAQHPRLHYGAQQLSVFLEIDQNSQKLRIQERSPQLYHKFMKEWIPKENDYFHHFAIKEYADFKFHR